MSEESQFLIRGCEIVLPPDTMLDIGDEWPGDLLAADPKKRNGIKGCYIRTDGEPGKIVIRPSSQIREGLRKHGLDGITESAKEGRGAPEQAGQSVESRGPVESEPGKRCNCWNIGHDRAAMVASGRKVGNNPNCPIHGTPTEER